MTYFIGGHHHQNGQREKKSRVIEEGTLLGQDGNKNEILRLKYEFQEQS
jgi:hypothetical protein